MSADGEAELCSEKEKNTMSSIPGYTHGTSAVAKSPVTLTDFEQMKASVLFGEDDVKYLRMSHDVVKDEVEAILDVWYGFVGSQPHLLASFTGKADGKPLGDYLGAVRKRFGQWILDTAHAEYDQKWLDYQHEIGSGTTGRRRTRPTAPPRPTSFRSATCSRSSSR